MKRKLLMLPLLICFLASCDDGIERNTPLGWCAKDVLKNYDYECPYAYTEIEYPKGFYDDIKEKFYWVDCYEIRVFAYNDNATDYYYCVIGYDHFDPLDRAAGRKVYARGEVDYDCDFLYRIKCEDAK